MTNDDPFDALDLDEVLRQVPEPDEPALVDGDVLLPVKLDPKPGGTGPLWPVSRWRE